MTIQTEIGRRIRDARRQMKLTQAELGQRFDPPFTHAAVCDIEKGRNNFSVARLYELAMILGKPVEYFYSGIDSTGVADRKAVTMYGKPDTLRYVVVYSPPSGYTIDQRTRDHLFATGNVIDVRASSLYSLQQEHLKGITRRPLTVILVNMADRYSIAAEMDFDVIEAKDLHDAESYAANLRPTVEHRQFDPEYPHASREVTVWKYVESA